MQFACHKEGINDPCSKTSKKAKTTVGLWVGWEGWLEIGALGNILGHTRTFEILWVEDHLASVT